jgi:hypothetical protein
LLQVLDRAYDDSRPLTIIDPADGAAATCDDDSCAV